MRFEDVLGRTQEKTKEFLKKALSVSTSLRSIESAASSGDVKEIRKRVVEASCLARELHEQIGDGSSIYNFADVEYLLSAEFRMELKEAASRLSLELREEGDRLLCYPTVVRVLAAERAIQIGKRRETRIRPTHIADQLKKISERPDRFDPARFANILFKGYKSALALVYNSTQLGTPVPLLEVYRALTPLARAEELYPLDEFIHEVYLLDRSGTREIGDSGISVDLVGSGILKIPKYRLKAVTPEGEKVYGAVSFRSRGESCTP